MDATESWLNKQVSLHGDAFEQQLIDAMQQAGVYDAVFGICGPFGVRRFVLRFVAKGHTVDITEIETLPLQYGGGAPQHTNSDRMDALKRSLKKLKDAMHSWAPWDVGILGVVRDCDNAMQVIPFFDADVEGVSVEHLPTPPQGHPLEERGYLHIKSSVQAQIEPVYMNTSAISHDWTEWSIDGEVLTLMYDDDIESTVERKRCQVLATFDADGIWTWQVEQPLFSEEVFCWEYFICDWDSAVELSMVCTARLNGTWVFYSLVSTDPQVTLFVAVWD